MCRGTSEFGGATQHTVAVARTALREREVDFIVFPALWCVHGSRVVVSASLVLMRMLNII